MNGNCPLAAEPPCFTAEDGKPCFDLAVDMNSFDIKKYELLIETTTKWIEVLKEYGREDMVKANQKNLERYQNIYDTIKGGGVIFEHPDRVKRKFERKKRVGVKGAKFNREEQIRELHEKRKQAIKNKVEEAIKRLTKSSKAINFNSVAEKAGVNKATLYNHSELKERINFLRNQQERAFVDSRIKRDENNQNAIIASYKRRIEKLENKIKELEEENKRLREFCDKKRKEGKLYRVSIIACANKLLHWIYALLKTKTTF